MNNLTNFSSSYEDNLHDEFQAESGTIFPYNPYNNSYDLTQSVPYVSGSFTQQEFIPTEEIVTISSSDTLVARLFTTIRSETLTEIQKIAKDYEFNPGYYSDLDVYLENRLDTLREFYWSTMHYVLQDKTITDEMKYGILISVGDLPIDNRTNANTENKMRREFLEDYLFSSNSELVDAASVSISNLQSIESLPSLKEVKEKISNGSLKSWIEKIIREFEECQGI